MKKFFKYKNYLILAFSFIHLYKQKMTSNIKTYLHFNPLQIKTHSAFITIQQLNKLHDELELNNLPLNKENLKEWFSYLDNNHISPYHLSYIFATI